MEMTRALERRSVVQATLMRGTIHVVSATSGRSRWRSGQASASGGCACGSRGRTSASSSGPRTSSVIDGGVGRVAAEELTGVVGQGWGILRPWLELVLSAALGNMGPASCAPLSDAERWIGPEDIDREAALDHVVRRYLAPFGPGAAHGHRVVGRTRYR